MIQARHIIAAVGQFPQDDPVLTRAVEIARAHRARLTVAHVIDSLTGFDSASTELMRIQQQMRIEAYGRVEAAVAEQAAGVDTIDIRIETGSPFLRLIDLIDEGNADLVVMRAHQRDSVADKIIGSTTDRVIRASNSPVLVVKRPATRAYQRVVVATATADDSDALVPFAAALFPQTGLYLIHVVQIPPQLEAAMLHAGVGQSVAAHRQALVRKAKAELNAVSKRLDPRPIRGMARVLAGDPATSLVRATWSPKVGLIVLGPGGAGRIRRALLGSVTQRVLNNAACDVLICRTLDGTAPGDSPDQGPSIDVASEK
ncbi:MAG TPA: universal stress protein [Thiohalobacter sp.]|nr:universal stress protein [Thiohalobacter sp.]